MISHYILLIFPVHYIHDEAFVNPIPLTLDLIVTITPLNGSIKYHGKIHHAQNLVQNPCTKLWVGFPTILGLSQPLLGPPIKKIQGTTLNPMHGGYCPYANPSTRRQLHPCARHNITILCGASFGENITHTQKQDVWEWNIL